MDKVIKDVAIYLRLSRDKVNELCTDGDSLQNHRERLIKLCESRGYNIKHIYEEILSGQSKLEDRLQLNLMLDEIQQYDGVVCVAIDRLSRDLEYSIHIYKRLEKAGVPIITPERIYTEQDFVMYGFESLMAHNEYKMIRKRMMEGKKDRSLRGEQVNSNAPYGYRFTRINGKRTYEIYEEEAIIVRKIYNLCINGYSFVSISNMVGKPPRSIARILENKAYIGTSVFNNVEVPKAFTPIIDEETYIKAGQASYARYSGREAKVRNGRGNINTIIRDLLFCGECGRKISFQMNGSNKYLVSRKCKCGLKGSKEDYILSEFYHQLEEVEKHFKEAWKNTLDTPLEDNKGLLESQLNDLNQQKEKLEKRLKNYKVMRADGEISKVDFEELKLDAEASLNELQKKIQELSTKLESMDKEAITKQYEDKIDLIGRFKALDTSIPKKGEMITRSLPTIADKVQANRLLKLLIDKIYYSTFIDEDGVERVKLLIAPK